MASQASTERSIEARWRRTGDSPVLFLELTVVVILEISKSYQGQLDAPNLYRKCGEVSIRPGIFQASK